MDTKEVAALIGTDPRTLRQFLRSPSSTFVAVGSGARYDFTDRDVPMLRKKFSDWSGGAKATTPTRTAPVKKVPVTREVVHARDEEVWAEEGEVTIPDIRDPRVRARVRRDAREREERLMMLLMANGLHVMQRGDRTK